MAALFQKDVRTINEHLVNIYDDGELDRGATIRRHRIVRIEGNRLVSREIEHYSLEAILAVGFLERVRDIRASEQRFYQKVLDIHATSVEYRPDRRPAVDGTAEAISARPTRRRASARVAVPGEQRGSKRGGRWPRARRWSLRSSTAELRQTAIPTARFRGYDESS